MDLSSLWAQTPAYGVAAGAALPLVAAVVLRPHWAAATKQRIVMTLSLLSGLATVAGTGAFSKGPVLTAATVATVYVAGQAAYKGLWHPVGIAQAIETSTSPKPALCTGKCVIQSGTCLTCSAFLGGPAVVADDDGEDSPADKV
jgi:hypothetical protein